MNATITGDVNKIREELTNAATPNESDPVDMTWQERLTSLTNKITPFLDDIDTENA